MEINTFNKRKKQEILREIINFLEHTNKSVITRDDILIQFGIIDGNVRRKKYQKLNEIATARWVVSYCMNEICKKNPRYYIINRKRNPKWGIREEGSK